MKKINFDDSKLPINNLTPERTSEIEKVAMPLLNKEIELYKITEHFKKLYAEEIAAGEVNGNVIHEWWNSTKEQYHDDVTYEEVEKAIMNSDYYKIHHPGEEI